ncbi:MAG: hypothetical protein K8R56_07475 [Candidatus Eisenbacteria bacterium]|nr:hypothetical protein [Candidatus Eisenbacteria bacterium]
MTPETNATLRRYWPALASLLVLALLWAVHSLAFAPLAARYRAQLADAGEIGASLDPRLAEAPLPPRVTDLLRRNSVAAADADRLARSGFLATDLVRRLSDAAVECGIEVAASEPGLASQTPSTLEVRAHLRLRCRYAQFVELLDDLAKERSFYRIERMAIQATNNGQIDAEIWMARILLKRGGRK